VRLAPSDAAHPDTLDDARMAKVVDGVLLAVLDLTGSSRS
jgi:hypothetical protein